MRVVVAYPRRFSFRVLLAFLIVCSAGCGFIGWKLSCFRLQSRALQQIVSRHPYSQVAWEPPAYPRWWRYVEDATDVRCANVVALAFGNRCDLRDAECLRHLAALRYLDFPNGVTDDDVLLKVAELPELEALSLRSGVGAYGTGDVPPAPSNRGIRALARLPKLHSLYLESGLVRTADGKYVRLVDDDGLLPVTSSAPLRRLDVGWTDATMTSLRPLLERNTLIDLGLPASFASQWDELAQSTSLRQICIRDMPVRPRVEAPFQVSHGFREMNPGFTMKRAYQPH